MEKKDKIYIAGHNGLVGSAICRRLENEGFDNLILYSSNELDLRDQKATSDFFNSEKPEYVFLAAGKVGGIQANSTYPSEFLYDNIMIQNHVIHHSYLNKVKKLLFLGSSCIYPKMAPQPLKEIYLLSDYLEPTNEAYALAKIAGIKMCEYYNRQYGCNFFSVMPTNLYGQNDKYDLNNSHVLPALLRKFHEAKIQNKATVEIWGSGKPLREFLYVDDLADACLFLMENYDKKDFVNIGSGIELSIKELALKIKAIVGFEGKLVFNTEKPDGTPRKLLDTSRMDQLGWKSSTTLDKGIELAYRDMLESYYK
ncbi:MAG: GDP-L-fucose synthase [Chitinophagales bacterium]